MDTNQITDQTIASSKKFSKKQIIILVLIVFILVIVGVYFLGLYSGNNFAISSRKVFAPIEDYTFDEPMTQLSEDSSTYNYTLIKLGSDGQNQEIEFVDNEINLWDLNPGENNLLLVKSLANGKTESSRVFKIFYDQPKVEQVDDYSQSSFIEEATTQEDQDQSTNLQQADQSSKDLNIDSSKQTSKTEEKAPEEPSRDNGDGTYTIFKGGNLVNQYRFYDHKEVVAKCRDEATNFNTIVFVENGVDRVDIDCRNQDQVCREFVNEEGKADAKCD
ncbi:MAG: hypothetical protein US86_C0005G0001 [Candidatus Daviesbacteria bacterium GW2011_GWA2_38_24]|uniref:Uncharacterized protein n=1 Tax=Candidatus Daviesbacteria bacterium GW2011_GWA2_38_24 TaxID=1618422 RepID=A0A0G0JTM9_9BACT|nr:MAG: hypothetical protein US86_C0005G0001 [Candidatus Daviesbacteria bacterium GW2011_GWA2_38_24]KKQ80060.1 MAG: hypothetical protein UT01_C0021G0011 [Candidatus Daviesbacteria bacterium GW2011_GWA1_38_7]